MTNDEMIFEMLRKMDSRLDKMDSRLDKMDSRLDKIEAELADIKETQDEHTTALNELLEWADNVQVAVKVPFAQANKIRKAE